MSDELPAGASASPAVEPPCWVMITNGGSHPPEAWAEITAQDIVRVETDDGRRLRKALSTRLAAVFKQIMTGMHRMSIPALVAVAAYYVEHEFAASPWPDHFATPQAKADIRTLIRRFADEAYQASYKEAD